MNSSPAVERTDAAGDRDQGFLRGVERVLLVAEHAATHGVHAIEMAREQRVERAAVTARSGTREGPIRLLLVPRVHQ